MSSINDGGGEAGEVLLFEANTLIHQTPEAMGSPPPPPPPPPQSTTEEEEATTMMIDYHLSPCSSNSGGDDHRPARKWKRHICYERLLTNDHHVMFKETTILNYRDPSVWPLVLADLLTHIKQQTTTIGAVRLTEWPVLGVVCDEELDRKDSADGDYYYSPHERTVQRIVQPNSFRACESSVAMGMLGCLARGLFKESPQTLLMINANTPEQCGQAAVSGCLPVDCSLLTSFLSTTHDLTDHLDKLSKCLPPSGVVVAPPVSLATIADKHLSPAQLCAWYSLQVLGPFFPWLPSNETQAPLGDHLRMLKSLRDLHRPEIVGASQFLTVPCPVEGQQSPVIGFARFGGDSPAGSVLLCAINLSSTASSFHFDCSCLSSVLPCAAGSSGVFQMTDLLHQHNAPQLLSHSEVLEEIHQVDLAPWESLCWLVTPSDSGSALIHHSCVRLEGLLAASIDPHGNKVFSDLTTALATSSPPSFVSYLTSASIPATTVLSFSRHCDHSQSIHQFLHQCSSSPVVQEALKQGQMRQVVIVSAEIGRFSTVGGVGVVVDELSQSLASLGFHVTVISPYYNWNKYGQTGYLAGDQQFSFWGTVKTWVGQEQIELGVHRGVEKGVDLVFMHNFKYFPSIYSGNDPAFVLSSSIALSKGALDVILALKLQPSVVISNDWPTALTPAYAKYQFGGVFGCPMKCLHVIHNADKGYEGRLFFDHSVDSLWSVHQLPQMIIQQFGDPKSLNLTLAALKTTDNWATVSKSYQKDLIERSQFATDLRMFSHSFACSNGVRERERLAILKKVSPTLNHWEAKQSLQKKYFPNSGNCGASTPVFGFVGRICEQKGVELLCWVARDLILSTRGQIQFIIGGFAPNGDPYAARCSHLLRDLHAQFPNSFWAEPDRFFLDGGLLNLGCDFAVMPSLFEPSGVVQQEFFLAGTPVVAFKTGGLRDTVFEGTNGFTFESYKHEDLRYAIERALGVFGSSQNGYESLRKSARASVLTMDTVAKAWAAELCRMCGTLLPIPNAN